MAELVLTTYDWVPPPPRGFVRDLRIRWALEEASLPYRVEATPFRERGADHLAHQPFGQVPWLADGPLSIFESGAILLHLGTLSPALMPEDTAGRMKVTEWVFAAMNSVETVTLPCVVLGFRNGLDAVPTELTSILQKRLDRLEPVFSEQPWLAGQFSVADIAMADVLRVMDQMGALSGHNACRDYVARAKERPAFKKAHADQMAHFAAADT